ncbi:MAG TPA: IS1595 family transposase, partial [Cyclobacteriaceae bacterium]|nr:IS1595 family transposase [Cyclobacteriaceae bacterium]
MNVKNRYYFRSRIREAKFRQLIRCFSLDFTATSTAQLTG